MYKQGKFYAFSATGFLYATIVVDLYRKLVGVNVEGIRNIIYIFFFALLLIDMYKSRHLKPMSVIGIVMMVLFGFSIALNPGYPEVYKLSVIFFFSRLWPAYYIGRYTEDWGTLSKSVLLFSPLALVYALAIFIVPDFTSGAAYATIASNLAYVTLISLFACFYYNKKNILPIPIICLIPVLFYGTRVFFLGVVISLLLAYVLSINRRSSVRTIFLLGTLAVIVIVFVLNNEAIFNRLYLWFPNSRTLKMMSLGDFLDDSNRYSFYNRIFSHLKDQPLSMLGLIGDRIYLSSKEASVDDIISNFSHNCSLELCMDFGVLIGIVLNLYFLKILIKALRKSFKTHNVINYVFVLILGVCVLNMMISVSFMSEYMCWMLFGLAFCICDMKNNISIYSIK